MVGLPAKMNRAGLAGAVWSLPFAVHALGTVVFQPGLPGSVGSDMHVCLARLLPVLGVLGATAPLGTTLCGLVALRALRRGPRHRADVFVAVFDATVFPVLGLTVGALAPVYLLHGAAWQWALALAGATALSAWLVRAAIGMATPAQQERAPPAADVSGAATKPGFRSSL